MGKVAYKLNLQLMYSERAKVNNQRHNVNRFGPDEYLVTEAFENQFGDIEAIAAIAHAGIYPHLNDKGDDIIYHALPAEELFTYQTYKTLMQSPITNDHPEGMVDNRNVNDVRQGYIKNLYVDSNSRFAYADIVFTGENIKQAIRNGKRELSVGYYADPVTEPGEIAGASYTVYHKNVEFNHLALVDAGRAGPDVGVDTSSITNSLDKIQNMLKEKKMVRFADKVSFDQGSAKEEPEVKNTTSSELIKNNKESKPMDGNTATTTTDGKDVNQKLAELETRVKNFESEKAEIQRKADEKVKLHAIGVRYLNKEYSETMSADELKDKILNKFFGKAVDLKNHAENFAMEVISEINVEDIAEPVENKTETKNESTTPVKNDDLDNIMNSTDTKETSLEFPTEESFRDFVNKNVEVS